MRISHIEGVKLTPLVWLAFKKEIMKSTADIHCHIIPYVDDGAQTASVSEELVEMLYSQGVRTVCCTPHLRRGMFETPDEAIKEQLTKLTARAKEAGYPEDISFFLSREYHADKLLLKALEQGTVIPYGTTNNILLEFSNAHPLSDIHWFIRTVQDAGFRPLIAHVERYRLFWDDISAVKELIDMGARLQSNCSSVLGREGHRQQAWCKKLLKNRLIHVVASDGHDPEDRPPEIDAAANYLTRKFGEEYAEQLLCANPINILTGN